MQVLKNIKFEITKYMFESKNLIKDFFTYLKERYCKIPKPIRIKIEKKQKEIPSQINKKQ